MTGDVAVVHQSAAAPSGRKSLAEPFSSRSRRRPCLPCEAGWTTTHAQEHIKLLSSHAHGKNLAIAQKNTPELSGNRTANGLDFAVSEGCGEWEEHTNSGRSAACSEWGGKISIVQCDVRVKPAGSSGYVRKTC